MSLKLSLDLVRFPTGKDSTFGKLHVDSEFECYTLEDEYRKVKVRGETRIPEGNYQVTLRTVGDFHGRYKRRFPKWHKGMLWVRDVPGFEYILIHCGNTDDDTAGCILVGAHFRKAGDTDHVLDDSVVAYERLYKKVVPVLIAGGEVTLRIWSLTE